ncbi:MAG: phytanoyl-CoA dioxygenase, partial [Rhodobacterales bacterium]|nr:phytanoyl-CoA dioxygenase [Rhodobacterales bacterium]
NFKPQRFDGSDLFEGDKSEVVPDVDTMRDQFDIIGWEMEPGDAVAFHFRTLHGAPANSSKSRRRVISIRWVGDDATFVKRLGPTSPSFPELTFEDGEPFSGEDFPILFVKNKIE